MAELRESFTTPALADHVPRFGYDYEYDERYFQRLTFDICARGALHGLVAK